MPMEFDNKDVDYIQLLDQNRILQSELTQCKSDKDFVWSLWKRLQVSNPDVTEAISLVIHREKEKTEAKDHQVLKILQVKDDRIEELQNLVAKQSQEISELLARKVDLQEKAEQLRSQTDTLHDKLTTMELKLKGHETKEHSMDDTFRRTVEDNEREKRELQRRITALTTELEVTREEKANVAAKRMDLECTVRNLERDVSQKISRFDGLIRELEEAGKRADKAERQAQQLTQEVDFKNQELESVRKELKELWNSDSQLTEHSAQQAQLIQQLQSLQQNTQIMIKNQEDAFSVESNSMQQMYQDVCLRYESSRRMETELRQQILQLKKDLMDRDDCLAKLQQEVQLAPSDQAGSSLVAPDRSTMEARCDLDAFRQLEKTIDKLDQSMDRDDTLEFDLSHTHRSGRHSTPSSRSIDGDLNHPTARRSRSLSPKRHGRELVENRLIVEQQLADTKRHLELKTAELEALHRAHSRRLERLRAVQHSEKLLLDQLRTYEEYQSSRKKKKPQRCDPRHLQRENSDGVWNELSYFKTVNRKLEVERLSLQEELDELKVQVAVDAATLHELRVNLQAQREEFDYQLKKRESAAVDRTDMESEMVMLRSRIQSKDIHIGKLEKDLQEIAADRDMVLAEKKELKNQANELQQELSGCKIQIVDLQHAFQRQQRTLEECLQEQGTSKSRGLELGRPIQRTVNSRKAARRKPTHRIKKPHHSSSSVKWYQQALNKSIEKMCHTFANFKDDGWEETTETGEIEDWGDCEEEEDTETTADSLGAAIVYQARKSTPGVVSATASETAQRFQRSKVKVKRIASRQKRTETKTELSSPRNTITVHMPYGGIGSHRSNPSPSNSEKVVLREVATSPIPLESVIKDRSPCQHILKTKRRQLALLKQRVANLTQQLTVLRGTRTVGLKKFAELKEINQQLAADLNLANQRLRTTKLTCQRLSADVERLQREKQQADQQLSLINKSEGDEKQNDSDKRLLEARLKMSSSEVSRQAATIRSLKTEVELLQDQIRGFQDRINHLERDNNQKRNLLESQRIKLKASQEASKTHDDAMEELQTKLKLSAESSEKRLVQLDSLKKRMRVVTQEKRDYEDKYMQVSLSLEKKSKELSVCREQSSKLQSAMSQLETVSQQQLQRVATHSEAAVDAAQAQVSATHSTLTQYQQFVKLLCAELLDRVTIVRRQLKESKAEAEAKEAEQVCQSTNRASLKQAQATACNILNISQSDLEDIMSADGDHAAQEVIADHEGKKDRKWLRKCEKVMASKDNFARPLASLVLQLVDERGDLLTRLFEIS